MANPEVRAFPMYWNGKKIATAYEGDYKIGTGRTRLFGAEGYLCHSKGAVVTTLSINLIIPVAGENPKTIEAALAQEDVTIGVPVGGFTHLIVMAITEKDMKTNTERGTVEGSMTLEGGMPEINAF